MSWPNKAGVTSYASQALTVSGLNPVLGKYKKYLRSCYNARVLASADKYLPTLESPYINLAMIRSDRYNHEQRDEFTRRTLHGGVDQILENKTPINIEDLLTPEDRDERYQTRVEGGEWLIYERQESMIMPFSMTAKDRECSVFSKHSEFPTTQRSNPENQRAERNKRPVRFILVEGPPGIGKSTFAWEVCRRWDEIESLRAYHTVVLLKLREKWVLNTTSLSDLFRCPYQPEFSNTIADILLELQGEKLLLVLDGFDEVSHNFHENSVIKSILCRQLLPECTIILTTRPVAMYALKSICQPQVDKHVEIIGFTEEERVRYITEVFNKEPELQGNFLKYMFLVPHIKSMMYIPLNCAIIAQVYYESQSSHHLAIPRTRTQLYKALTHSLLVRHMKMKESNCEYISMLPEGLDEEHRRHFKTLAKFAFDTYHKGYSRKVTFFKEDIPEGLVHFGFMNESTEMYAGKGVERTFSFLHLSLQEYLAAWHLADSYSIEFQVAYHRLAIDSHFMYMLDDHRLQWKQKAKEYYKGDNENEQGLILSLQQQWSIIEEPAIFLAGLTGCKSQSKDDWNCWKIYLSHDTADTGCLSVFLRSLYEAQNPTLLSHHFVSAESGKSKSLSIGTFGSHTNTLSPYDCYALSYCLAHSSGEFSLSIGISSDDDVSLVETFVKGLKDHCISTTPIFTKLIISHTTKLMQNSNNCLFWLNQANYWTEVEELEFNSHSSISSDLACKLFKTLVNLQYITLYMPSWEWLHALQSLSECNLKGFYIISKGSVFLITPSVNVAILDIEFPSSTIMYSVCHPITLGINSLLNSVHRFNQITTMCLSSISRDTMATVCNILIHYPNLITMWLYRTRLGYDGILYICKALRYNTSLRRLVIDDLQSPPSRNERLFGSFTSMLFIERVPLPGKTTCTDFLFELNNILKDNATLEEMKIWSGLFLPLSVRETHERYCQWTGLGPLQQFNVGAVGSGMSPYLRRSFSSSDLTQPQTTLFWDKWFGEGCWSGEIDFKQLFSRRKEEGKKLLSLPSFTAPDTEVLQSFSGLDPRLKECLEISNLNQYVAGIELNCWGMFRELATYVIHPKGQQTGTTL